MYGPPPAYTHISLRYPKAIGCVVDPVLIIYFFIFCFLREFEILKLKVAMERRYLLNFNLILCFIFMMSFYFYIYLFIFFKDTQSLIIHNYLLTLFGDSVMWRYEY